MKTLSLDGSKNDSLLDGVKHSKACELIEKTDDTLVKKRHNEPREHGDSSSELNSARVKGELAGYAYPLTVSEKLRDVERFAGMWEPYFYHEIYRPENAPGDVDSVPEHPWMTLKNAREKEGGVNSLSLEERYALRFVKTFYAELWRDLG